MTKTLNRKRVFQGKVVNVDECRLQFDNGNLATYELISFNVVTGVSALPVIDDQLILTRHYQLGIDALGFSLPTGGLEKGEKPEERMQQEMQEEIGYKAGKLTLMTRIHTLPGYIGSDAGYIYLAQDLIPSRLPGDEDYDIEIVKLSLNRALELIQKSEIRDGRTVLAILYYHHLKSGSLRP